MFLMFIVDVVMEGSGDGTMEGSENVRSDYSVD